METIVTKEAVEAIRNGQLIIFPTDTVYGIGCDLFNEEALKLLYIIKGRSNEKSIPVLVDSIETARTLVTIPHYCEELLKRHWPGALTIVLHQKIKFPKSLSNDGTVALRMPKHNELLKLISNVGGALATTGANISDKKPLLSYDEVYATFSEKISVILPGVISVGVSSTIVDCTGKNPKVLREGSISIL